jgi:hypothetical protein
MQLVFTILKSRIIYTKLLTTIVTLRSTTNTGNKETFILSDICILFELSTKNIYYFCKLNNERFLKDNVHSVTMYELGTVLPL